MYQATQLKDYVLSPEFMELFKELFRGRCDVVPKFNTKHKAYFPICNNFWKTDVCPKKIEKDIKCSECKNADYAELNDDLLIKHFQGVHRLGVYPLLKDNTCRFIAADFDEHDNASPGVDPESDVKKLIDACECQNIIAYPIKSKSGKGFHVSIFFDAPVPAWKARLVYHALIEEAGLDKETHPNTSFDRLFPAQDELSNTKSTGNLISLPFHGDSIAHGNTIFWSKYPFPSNQMQLIQNIKKVSESKLDELISDWNLKRPKSSCVSSKRITKIPSKIDNVTNDDVDILLSCDFIRWTKEFQAGVEEPLWLAMLSNLVPLGDIGISLCHEYSKEYPKYTIRETDKKIQHVEKCINPLTCAYIRENGYNCTKDCGVKSPIGLIYKGRKMNVQNLKKDTAVNENIIDEILTLSKDDPDNFKEKILENDAYIDALVIAAESKSSFIEVTKSKWRKNKVMEKDVKAIISVVNEERNKQKVIHIVQPNEEIKLIPVKQIIPDAPVSDDIVIPAGWELTKQKELIKVSGKKKMNRTIVCHEPVLITGVPVDNQSNIVYIKLSFMFNGVWVNHVTERMIISAKKSLVTLSNYGLPVYEENAKDLITFLHEFENVNKAKLPRIQISHQLGWQPNGSFLLGKTLIQSDGNIMDGLSIDSVSHENCNKDWVTYRADDAGNKQLASAYRREGSYEEWCNTINKLTEYRIAMAAVYFSLAAPLLEIFKVPNFTVDFSYETSSGKTTIQKIAASCWGNPHERQPDTVLHSWKNTENAIEKMAEMLKGLPLILSDTKQAGALSGAKKTADAIADIVYYYETGQSKTRGSLKGIQKRGSCRGILISTGEQLITNYTKSGGVSGRVISFWECPFNERSTEKGIFVKKIERSIQRNYGHAGEKVVKFIIAHKKDWPKWIKAYHEQQEKYIEKAGDNSVAGRISDYFAFFHIGIALIHGALPELVTPNIEELMNYLWESATKDSEHIDRVMEAAKFLFNWFATHPNRFYNPKDKKSPNDKKPDKVIEVEPNDPFQGWTGYCKKVPAKEREALDTIAFERSQCIDLLQSNGFDAEAVVKGFKDRGWLNLKIVRGKTVGNTKQHRIKGNQVDCVSFNKKCIKEVLNENVPQLSNKESVTELLLDEDSKRAFADMFPESIIYQNYP